MRKIVLILLRIATIALFYAAFSFFLADDELKPKKLLEPKTTVTPINDSAVAPKQVLGEKELTVPIPAEAATAPQTQAEPAPSVATVKKQLAKQPASVKTEKTPSLQIIKGIITEEQGLLPNSYSVKAGTPVRFEIDPQDDIDGCMSTILIDRLYERASLIKADEEIVMEFTPEQTGEYYIICVMGSEWGIINVVE
ncbi:MAG: cupredoxin domain-containing protein [bacterium]|nr:cupredoxin domain-containing protein [bacterium]